MPKSCRVKARTKQSKKRKGFCGAKKSGDVNIDSNVDVNNVNSDNEEMESIVNSNDNNEQLTPLTTTTTPRHVNTPTVSEKKVEIINVPSPSLRNITGNRIMDMDILSSIICLLLCPVCKLGNMKLSEITSKKKGLASCLLFQCSRCSYFIEQYTSKSNKQSFEINTRAVYSMRSCGQGYAGLERFTSLMNMPKPITANNFDKIVNHLAVSVQEVAEETMTDACRELKQSKNEDTSIVTDVDVSCDGSWQKRGYSSKNGVVTIISMDTGKVLDVEPMSKSCKACSLKDKLKNENPAAYDLWKAEHLCKMNYVGTAGNMEPVGAKRIWERSILKNGLRYVKFYGDGDSKGFCSVQNTYGELSVEKLECVGHVQKRVGCRLRNLKKREKGLGGKGKLTDNLIDKLQIYYGVAIRSNKNDLAGMQAATRATLFHVASSAQNNYHFPHCPTGKDSWCKYNKDRANGTNTYKPGPGLPLNIIMKVKPIFQELSSTDLLMKCLHGRTQNQNESFNAMIWDRLPKIRFVSLQLLKLGVYDAVANFNVGRKASVLIYEKLGIIPGTYTLQGCRKINRKRLFTSKYANLETTKSRRKIRRGTTKARNDQNQQKSGKSYEAGAF